MNFLLDLPPFLLIALGLAIVNGIKFVIEKVQERRGGGGQFDWPEPDEDSDWQEPQTYQQPPAVPPETVERRAPQRHASVPPPIGTPIPQQNHQPEPAWSTSGPIQSQEILNRNIDKPTLSKAEQAALDRLKDRSQGRKRSRRKGRSLVHLSEREFLRTQLRHPRSARHAIVLTEVLGPPIALRK